MYVNISLEELGEILRECWDIDTCYKRDRCRWTPECPEIGQCFVTALVVNDFFGGLIVYNKKYKHYYNILPEYGVVDFTVKQFGYNVDICPTRVYSREAILKRIGKDSLKRYIILKNRVCSILKNRGYENAKKGNCC